MQLDVPIATMLPERLEGNDVEGTLVYFGEWEDEEATTWFMQSDKPITPVYYDSDEME